ncbi:hypothetical protein ACEPAF_1999 [Sanghuangporus sanghuang]
MLLVIGRDERVYKARMDKVREPSLPTCTMSIDYCLRVIRVEDIQWKHPLHSKIPDLYVDVELHGVCRKTRTIKNSRTPFWDELLVFSSSDRDATFAVRVRHDAVLLSDPNVGSVDVSLEELLARSANGEAGSRVEAVSRMAEAAQSNAQGELHQSLNMLTSRLMAFETVIDKLSEANQSVPKVNMEYYLDSLYPTTFDFVTKLQEFSDEAAGLQVQEPIKGLLKKVIECCIFVQEHTARSFLGRAALNSQKIKEFEQEINNFKEQIDSGLTLYSVLAAHRESQRNNDTFLRQRLNPSHMDAFDRPLCLPGSRPDVMQGILEWVFSDTMQNIFWLHGIVGCGKSTISTTIADHLRDMTRLGAFLFFERGKSKPSSVIRTIAYKLSLFDSSIGSSILAEIENDKDIASATAMQQFNKLLLRPLLAAERHVEPPVVVVIDALDECGTPETRRSLMKLFRTEFLKLPKAFRFLITSRREPDIDEVFAPQQETIYMMELTREAINIARQGYGSDHSDLSVHSTSSRGLTTSLDEPFDHSFAFTGTIQGIKGQFRSTMTVGELFRDLSRLGDAAVMEDLHQLNDAALQNLVDQVQLAIDHSTSCNARHFNRFLKSTVEKRGILPSDIFLVNILRVGSNAVHGGGFADVWKGNEKEKKQREIGKEALVWRRLNHPNVLPFLGMFEDNSESPRLALVSDWMDKGSLNKYLSEESSADCLILALGVARGLGYLHSLNPQVIHGDLRAVNVLVDPNGQPQITDFGLARVIDSRGVTAATSFSGTGSARWQAPELLNPDRFGRDSTRPTSKSDVYAFSCVCFEIFSGTVPFADLNDGAVVTEVAVDDNRPGWPEQHRGLTVNVWELMQRCWKTQPVDRPDMPVVVLTLEAADLHKKLAIQDYTSSS